MNLLIVDDEISAIQAVSSMLDWPALGIGQCFTALSAQDAKECIQTNPVDILLCDIEMPQESGLDLLEWVNAQRLDITCIYMTCYAEFTYAQRAISLGSTAYLLKPIKPKELEREMTAAIQKKRDMRQMRLARKSLEESSEKITQQFWRDLFYDEIPSTHASIQQQIERLQLPMSIDWLYCPVLLVVRNWNDWNGQKTDREHRMGRYAVHNVAAELFADAVGPVSSWNTVFPFGQHGQMAICGGEDAASLRSACENFSQNYLEAEERYLDMSSVCYVGQVFPIERIANEIEYLLRTDNNHLQNHGLVLHTEAQKPSQVEADLEGKFERWGDMLGDGFFREVRTEITQFLTVQTGNAWFNKRRFRFFMSFYSGMLANYADQQHVPLKQLTAAPEDETCYMLSDRGLDYMKSWVTRSLKLLEQKAKEGNGEPITATKKYIENHLSEELDMEQIAENVHLNQDYLTRIFKRETGVSVKSYIVNVRLARAKELLRTSKLTIADVAYKVGYLNYTSFNRIFKKTFGVSPQGYRSSPD